MNKNRKGPDHLDFVDISVGGDQRGVTGIRHMEL